MDVANNFVDEKQTGSSFLANFQRCPHKGDLFWRNRHKLWHCEQCWYLSDMNFCIGGGGGTLTRSICSVPQLFQPCYGSVSCYWTYPSHGWTSPPPPPSKIVALLKQEISPVWTSSLWVWISVFRPCSHCVLRGVCHTIVNALFIVVVYLAAKLVYRHSTQTMRNK